MFTVLRVKSPSNKAVNVSRWREVEIQEHEETQVIGKLNPLPPSSIPGKLLFKVVTMEIHPGSERNFPPHSERRGFLFEI